MTNQAAFKEGPPFQILGSTIDVIQQAQETKANGILAFIDYEKAFDSARWDFLYKCLEKLNFGEYYIKCIKTQYTVWPRIKWHAVISENGVFWHCK